jgi:predicted DNA-binding transcriptional regulator AlpA
MNRRKPPQPRPEPREGPGREASPDPILNTKELRALVAISPVTVWRLERQGRFPKRLQLGARRVGWRRSEVEAWLDTRPRGIGAA